MQGVVYSANRLEDIHESAIKVHAQRDAYLRERDCYHRLTDREVIRIQGLAVPRLLGTDDELLAIEMALVHPPFVLDFGGAYLDQPPSHMLDPEIRSNWLAEKQEQFAENWSKVESILDELQRRYEIFVADVNPGNIQFKPQLSIRSNT